MATTTLTPTSASTDNNTNTHPIPKLLKKASTNNPKNPTTPTQTTFGCPHIKSLLQLARQQATEGYTRLVHSLRPPNNFSRHAPKTSSSSSTAASNNNDNADTVKTAQTTYLCLQCPHVSSTRDRHRKDHAFAVESRHAFILCHECHDFVYDPALEQIRTQSTTRKRKSLHHRQQALEADDNKKLIHANATPTPCAAAGLRGLYNMGQTCFMSVVLQALIHNPLIRSYYLSDGHRKEECEREACTSCALDDMFLDFYGAEKHEGYGAVHMLQGCWKGGGTLAGYSQQDAHEFLGFILDSLHTANTEGERDEDVDGDDADGENGGDGGVARTESRIEGERRATKTRKREESKPNSSTAPCDCAIHQTFGGQLRSTVTCSSCHNTTTSYEPFMDLPLDIPSSTSGPSSSTTTGPSTTLPRKKKNLSTTITATTSTKPATPAPPLPNSNTSNPDKSSNTPTSASAPTLLSCLSAFTRPEVLPAYTCHTCARPRKATKTLSLSKLPPCISLQLKRFECGTSSKGGASKSAKVETRVGFGKALDLGSFLERKSGGGRAGILEVKAEEEGVDGELIKVSHANGHNGEEILVDENNTRVNKRNNHDISAADAVDEEADSSLLSPFYELSAVIVHKGKIDNGHYLCYARAPGGSLSSTIKSMDLGRTEDLEGESVGTGGGGNGGGGEWFRFDDSMVVQVEEREVLSAQAYMLFYVVAALA